MSNIYIISGLLTKSLSYINFKEEFTDGPAQVVQEAESTSNTKVVVP